MWAKSSNFLAMVESCKVRFSDDPKSLSHTQFAYFGHRVEWLPPGKSMCISEVHGGAGLGCGPASAHYIAEQKAFQCILQGVRFLLANHTRLSPTSENESYPYMQS